METTFKNVECVSSLKNPPLWNKIYIIKKNPISCIEFNATSKHWIVFSWWQHYKLVYCNTLTALMLIKLIIEMLKFSKNMFFKVQNFVKEDRELIFKKTIFLHENLKFN